MKQTRLDFVHSEKEGRPSNAKKNLDDGEIIYGSIRTTCCTDRQPSLGVLAPLLQQKRLLLEGRTFPRP